MTLSSTLPKGVPKKKIWIDLDNSPHVPLFVPVIQELQRRNYSVVLTTRDCFQVCELADLYHLSHRRVGRHYGRHKLLKVLGTGIRALQLVPTALREKPDLAMSHGSRAQLVAATVARIPSVVMLDYEFAKPLPGVRPGWVLAPELIPDSSIPFRRSRVLKYPGIKEDVYVPGFRPEPGLRAQLGLSSDSILITVRPPANEAHYHNPESEELLGAAIELLSNTQSARVVLLPRNSRQASSLHKLWPDLFAAGKLIIPEHAIDGLNLIWHSDLVISGGGTMNREAAALGVPVYSIFRGSIGAVDRYLAASGRLVLLESVEDVRSKLAPVRRNRAIRTECGTRRACEVIVNYLVSIVESGGQGRELRASDPDNCDTRDRQDGTDLTCPASGGWPASRGGGNS